jgi:hypothetical protein
MWLEPKEKEKYTYIYTSIYIIYVYILGSEGGAERGPHMQVGRHALGGGGGGHALGGGLEQRLN